MYDAFVLWLHILAAIAFIGPQFFLVVAAVPAMRTIEDMKVRAKAMRTMTARFGMLGGGALVLLLITGVMNYYSAKDEIDTFKRYFITLQIKLTLVTLVVILTVLHGAVFGRKLQQLQESNALEAEIAKARQMSMYASMATLVLSIIIVFLAAMLGSDWTKMGALR
jgi:putative copper resistance protein D